MSCVLRAVTLGKLTEDDVAEIRMILNRSTVSDLEYSLESHENTAVVDIAEGSVSFVDDIVRWTSWGHGYWSAYRDDGTELITTSEMPHIFDMERAYTRMGVERHEYVEDAYVE